MGIAKRNIDWRWHASVLAGAFILSHLSACATPPTPSSDADSPRWRDWPQIENFTQRIEGTAIELEMIATGGLWDSFEPDKSIPPFYISKTEIPWELYDLFVYPELDHAARSDDGAAGGGEKAQVDAIARPSKPYVPPDRGFGHAGYPAISMTHHAATEFCKWLSARTGRTYRLPTRAEWQQAFRHNLLPGVSDLSGPWESAWLEENSNWKTHPVGTRNADVYRIHDMLGNAAEWIADDQDGDGLHEIVGSHYLTSARDISFDWIAEQTSAWNASDPQIPKSKWWLPDAPFVGFRVVCEPEDNETADERR